MITNPEWLKLKEKPCFHQISQLFCIIAACLFVFSNSSATAAPKPIILHPDYNHDIFNTKPEDIIKKFRAFTTSLDSEDDNDNYGAGDVWGIPE